MSFNHNEIELIENRVSELEKAEANHLQFLSVPYRELSELEKIPHRIRAAEIQALGDFLTGADLEQNLRYCIDKEFYCAAEGIHRAQRWLKLYFKVKS